MRIVSFFVPGKCETKGSVQAFPYVKTWCGKKPVLGVRSIATNARKLKAYEEAIRLIAKQKWREKPVCQDVSVVLEFRIPRPVSHHTQSGKKTKSWTSRPTSHQMGDIDKLSRAVIDGLQGVLFEDDKYVVELHTSKRFTTNGKPAGVSVTVIFLDVKEGDDVVGLPANRG